MKIISWNLFHRSGAAAADISALIQREKPDLFIMQEANHTIDALPEMVGGNFYKLPWRGKSYCLAAWMADDAASVRAIGLPSSRLPASFPPRVVQIIECDGLTIANVHLSHGQLLNRRQLRTIAAEISGPLAIIGDFNALGPIRLRGFRDVGPRGHTHRAQRVLPLRLDRCLVRGIECRRAERLDRGPSDHRPILLQLAAVTV